MSKHINLFELMKIMYTSPQKYADLNDIDKERNAFMINRLHSINFPLQAHLLGRNGIKGIHLVDFWQKIAARNRRVPSWVYTKTKNNTTKTKPFKYTHTDDAAVFLLKKKEWSLQDWNLNVRFNTDELKKELDYIDKQINIEIKAMK